MLALEDIHLKAQLSSKVLGSSWHSTDKNQMVYDTCQYYIQADVGCQAKQGVFSAIVMSGFYFFLSVSLCFVLEAMKICYLDNIIPIIEETGFLYSSFFWEEICRWIPVFHQLRKTQCSWEDKRAGDFKKALESVFSLHTVGITAQYMFIDLASRCSLRI